MASFEFQKTEIDGTIIINNFYVGDNRGGFTKCFEKDIYEREGLKFFVNETFVSISDLNVIRGLHFQKHNPQAKLVSVVSGKVWDVVVDLRPNSNTYKKWMSVELSSENHRSLFIPRGCAHGFASLENGTIMLYQCDGAYDKASDTGIIYNDLEIGIEWPIDDRIAIHSERDLKLQTLAEYEKEPMFFK